MATSSVLTIVIDNQSKEAKYRQLQRQIETLIEQKRLLPNEKLPSSRELVAALSISRTSVLKAIDNLIAEGVLTSQTKKGVFVSQFQPTLRLQSKPANPKIAEAASDSIGSVYTQASEIRGFDSGADTSVFPNLEWANSLKRAWLNPEQAMMQGEYADGFPELKRQICNYLRQLRGLNCSPQQIIVTAGSRDSLSILSYALLTASNASVWLEQACYPQIPALIHSLQKAKSVLPIDEEGACPPTNSIEKPGPLRQNMAILTPCRQYPLGLPMSSSRRQQWLDLVAQQKRQGRPFWIVEDDYDNEFVYQGRVSVPLMQQDQSSSTFFVGSFSKVLFRGLRLGFIVAPQEMAQKVKESQKTLGVAGASVAQPALADFMASGKFVTHLRRMRRHYLTKRNLLLDLLLPLSGYFDWQKVSGGMHLCLYLKPRYAGLEMEIEAEAKRNGLLLNPLSRHFLSSPKSPGFVVGFSQPTEKELTEFVDGLLKVTERVFGKLK